MFGLFLRTLSQGLQAFVPIAAAWTWLRRRHPPLASSVVIGLLVSLPLSGPAAWAFGQSTRKALDEAALAAGALGVAVLFLLALRTSDERHEHVANRPSVSLRLGIAVAAVLVVVRQTMEIGTVLVVAVFALHSLDATKAVLGGAALAVAVATAWTWLGRRASNDQLRRATQVFAAVFVVQVLVYCLHESAEARLLPWSDVLHEASEPYGPDGVYGVHFSELLVILPLLAVVLAPAGRTVRTTVLLLAYAIGAPLLSPGPASSGPASGPWTATLLAAADDLQNLTKRPHVVFRDTAPGSTFSLASVAPLDAPERTHAAADLACERVAFGGGRGVCLHAEKSFFGLFTGYTAVLLGPDFTPRGTPIKLDGKPSRARVSSDGKWGAFTVFVLGDGYDTNFSTRTTIVDLTTGIPIGDLESFRTVRNEEPFSARDFNFWGVTFAHDGNTFYASLRTSATTYLVRGDLAARRLTVLRENVECPSVSPDDRFVAFKKFIGPDPGAWRIAVIELATMKERLVAGETRYIDDQVEWLDADRLIYGITRRTTSIADVWVASATLDAPAKVWLPQAESPTVVR